MDMRERCSLGGKTRAANYRRSHPRPAVYRCNKCGHEKPFTIEFFPARRSSLHGLSLVCKHCIMITNSIYRRTSARYKKWSWQYEHSDRRTVGKRAINSAPENRAKRKQYYEEHLSMLEEVRSRRRVFRAIKDGSLVRPKVCSDCGRQLRLAMWFLMGFASPLMVIFVCRQCLGKRRKRQAQRVEQVREKRDFAKIAAENRAKRDEEDEVLAPFRRIATSLSGFDYLLARRRAFLAELYYPDVGVVKAKMVKEGWFDGTRLAPFDLVLGMWLEVKRDGHAEDGSDRTTQAGVETYRLLEAL